MYYFSFLHIVQDFYTVMMYYTSYQNSNKKRRTYYLKKYSSKFVYVKAKQCRSHFNLTIFLAHQSMPSEMISKGPKEKISCPICQVVVVRRVFRRHYETMHCVQNPVSCQFCAKTFKHRYSLDCHQRQSHPEEKKKKLKQILESQQKNDL